MYYRIKMFSPKLLALFDSNKVETRAEHFQSRPRLSKLKLPTFNENIENFVTFLRDILLISL